MVIGGVIFGLIFRLIGRIIFGVIYRLINGLFRKRVQGRFEVDERVTILNSQRKKG